MIITEQSFHPGDCNVTAWTEWSGCCDKERRRTRTAVTKPSLYLFGIQITNSGLFILNPDNIETSRFVGISARLLVKAKDAPETIAQVI